MAKRIVEHSYSYSWLLDNPTTIEFTINASVGPNPPGRISEPTNECFDAVVDFFGTKEFAKIALVEVTITNRLFHSLIATTLTKWVRKNVQQFPYRKISLMSLVSTYGLDVDYEVDVDLMFRR